MAEVIKAPQKHIMDDRVTIFLGGVIDQGKASNWAEKIAEALKDEDIVILNPRRDVWDPNLEQSPNNPQFFEQVTWELDYQTICDINVYVFAENFEEGKTSKAPITLLELGLFQDHTCVVCCPTSYWRHGNVSIVCTRYNIVKTENISELIPEIRWYIKEYQRQFKFRLEKNIPLR